MKMSSSGPMDPLLLDPLTFAKFSCPVAVTERSVFCVSREQGRQQAKVGQAKVKQAKVNLAALDRLDLSASRRLPCGPAGGARLYAGGGTLVLVVDGGGGVDGKDGGEVGVRVRIYNAETLELAARIRPAAGKLGGLLGLADVRRVVEVGRIVLGGGHMVMPLVVETGPDVAASDQCGSEVTYLLVYR